MGLARTYAIDAVSRLVHKVAENVVMHKPPTTVHSPPFCLSSLLLLETFPGQSSGRSSNGSLCAAATSLTATACGGHGSLPMPLPDLRTYGYTNVSDRSLVSLPLSLSRYSSSCRLCLFLEDAQLVTAHERIRCRLLHDGYPLPGSALRRMVSRSLIS